MSSATRLLSLSIIEWGQRQERKWVAALLILLVWRRRIEGREMISGEQAAEMLKDIEQALMGEVSKEQAYELYIKV